MSGVNYHIVAFACEKDTIALASPSSPFLRYDWLTGHLCYCCKSPLLGAREPSHAYSPWAQYVKRLLLAALAKKTNRGREARNERQ